MADPAYVDGLKLLARRELSEVQVRQRLTRRGHAPEAIDTAVARLRAERALDDARVAGAIAHTEIALKRHGRMRVRREIAAAGIADSVADHAVAQAFEDVDADALLAQSLDRRLRGANLRSDPRAFARLYRYLVGQGFEHDRVLAALRATRVPPDE